MNKNILTKMVTGLCVFSLMFATQNVQPEQKPVDSDKPVLVNKEVREMELKEAAPLFNNNIKRAQYSKDKKMAKYKADLELNSLRSIKAIDKSAQYSKDKKMAAYKSTLQKVNRNAFLLNLKQNPPYEQSYNGSRDCVDTNYDADGNELTDGWDGCATYVTAWCGNYDTADFNSLEMCCICGGGEEVAGEECDGSEITFNLVDSYGDGWNGGFITFGEDVLTIDDGAAASFDYCLADGDYTYTYTAGSWAGENSYSVSDADGNTLSTGDSTTGGGSFTVGGAAPVGGCTDANADNYNPDAEVDDGSCNPYCAVTDCGYWLGYGYDCGQLSGWGYDCSLCDAEGACPAVDPCNEAGGNASYIGDGWCDGSNNNESCGFDGGDCCESTCVDGTYSCESYGGCNGECLDPNGNDDACAPPACSDTEFDCNGDGTECIYDFWECDGWADCYNGADEADCGPAECADDQFDCNGDGTECIYGSWECDGWSDCYNGADEADCAPASCEDQGLWDCGDGQCIPTSYVCDGSAATCNAGWGPDCANGADESLDTCGAEHDECAAECNEGLTQCDEGWNIDCDGDYYVDDASLCSYYVNYVGYTCDALAYYSIDCTDFAACGGCEVESDPCVDAGGNSSWVGDGWCDGSNNNDACGYDGGDCCESTCVDGTYSCESYGGCNGECLDPNGNDDACAPPACSDTEFDCNGDGTECIYDFWECDGWADCYNGADEADCGAAGCADDQFDCNGDGTECIYGSWECDGWSDCYNGADEADCGELTCEDQGLWDCGDGQCIPTGYVCDGSSEHGNAGWGPDCANGADEILEDCCAAGAYDDVTCGGDNPYPDCTGNLSYIADGWCDGSNNNEGCGYDGGDCCPGDCVSTTYDCASYGGTCADCTDPASADLAEGGQCFDVEITCADTDCGYYLGYGYSCDEIEYYGFDCSDCADECDAQVTCDDPYAYNYGAIGDCVYLPDGWTCDGSYYFDSWCDCGCGVYDPTCDDPEASLWDNCGDDGCVDPTSTDCNEALAWDAEITGLSAEGVDYSDYYGYSYPAIQFNWDDLSDGTSCEDNGQATCYDGSCADTAEDCPEEPYPGCAGTLSWISDGYCDASNNNAECGFDGGDCCPGECEAAVADGCPDNPDGCYSTISCGDCASCLDADSPDLAEGGACADYVVWTDAECAATVAIAGSADLDGDGYTDDCYTDGTGYFSFSWDGGCTATSLFYVDSDGADQDLDLSAYGFNSGFFFYGFGLEESVPFIVGFAEASYEGAGTTDCAEEATCADLGLVDDCSGDGDCAPESWIGDGYCDGTDQAYGYDLTCYDNDGGDCDDAAGDDGGGSACDAGLWDCGDGQCIPESYVCDGSSEFCNAGWGPDCANGADEGLDACGYEDECATSDDGGGDDCVNDDSTSDSYGDTCSSWYDDYEGPGSSGCSGAYDDDDFSAATQCCVCAGTRAEASAPGHDKVSISVNQAVNAKIHARTYKVYKHSLTEIKGSMSTVMLDVATGEISYSSNSTANRAVSYTVDVSCDACLDGGPYSGSFTASDSEFLIYGFDDGSDACATVTGYSDVLGTTATSDAACATAGAACEFLDCLGAEACGYESWVGDGYCDDGTWGVNFDCEEFDNDGGDCGPNCAPGDSNADGTLNVLDIVASVNYIVSGGENANDDFSYECADYDGDGVLNVLDIVASVNDIVGNTRASDATDVKLLKSDNALNINANGYVGGVQMTLSHGPDFSITLTDKAMTAAYNTSGNKTTLVIVAPESNELFVANGEYEIDEMIIANSAYEINASVVPGSFELSEAYPNPFNPSTTINLSIPEAGFVSVQVYNVMGQLVSTLSDGYMDAGYSQMTWDAGSFSSGLYLITATTANNSSTQKVMLLK